MDAVMTRIIEIEKQSALDIKNAEEASRKKIEAHHLALEEEKGRAQADIVSTENNRWSQALLALKQQTEAASLNKGKDYESRFQNPALMNTVKEKIRDILLAG